MLVAHDWSTLVCDTLPCRAGQICGLIGLCQSEQTRRFYEKIGFETEEVYRYRRNAAGDMRSHWLVTWRSGNCEPCKAVKARLLAAA